MGRKGRFIDRLREAVEAAGLQLVQMPNVHHFQIKGGPYLVNVYPYANSGPTAYINGMVKGDWVGADVPAIVRLAARGQNIGARDFRQSSQSTRRIRKHMWDKFPFCHWCNARLPSPRGTDCHLDHKIPLSRGGASRRDNYVLACAKCDTAKANKMPHKIGSVSQ